MDREAWWATVHRVENTRTKLKQLSRHKCTLYTHTHTHKHTFIYINVLYMYIKYIYILYTYFIYIKYKGGNGNPLQYSCLENPPGQRRLVDCNPWGFKESDMIKHSTVHT